MREKEIEKERDRETLKQRDRHRYKERVTDRHTDREEREERNITFFSEGRAGKFLRVVRPTLMRDRVSSPVNPSPSP